MNLPLVIVELHWKVMFNAQIPSSLQTNDTISLFRVKPWLQVMVSHVAPAFVEQSLANAPLVTVLGHETERPFKKYN